MGREWYRIAVVAATVGLVWACGDGRRTGLGPAPGDAAPPEVDAGVDRDAGRVGGGADAGCPDSDVDGVCDADDVCPNRDDALGCGPMCIEDPFEDNDSFSQSFDLSSFGGINAAVCANDEDWWRIRAEGGCSGLLTVEFVHAQGDIDLRLADPATGQTFCDTDTDPWCVSNGVTNIETINFVCLETSDRCIADLVVAGFSGAENTYSLRYESMDCPPLVCPKDDRYETGPEDPPVRLIGGDQIEPILCPGDVDVYSILPPEGCELVVDLTWTDASQDLALQLYDSPDNVVDTSDGMGVRESVSANPTALAPYFIGVVGVGDASAPYTLSTSFRCP